MDDSSSLLRRLLYKPSVGESGNPSVKPLNALSPGATNGRKKGVKEGLFCGGRMVLKKGFCGRKRVGKCGSCLRSNMLTVLTMTSVLVGIALGLGLRTRTEPWTNREIMYITFPGDLFLRMLKCLILPLIVSSMVAALGGLDLRLSGQIGVRAITYYMGTTFLAVVLGIILVSVIHPGSGNPDEIVRAGNSRNVTTVDTLLDLVRNMFPPNIVEACISQYRTVLIYPGEESVDKFKDNKDGNQTVENFENVDSTNIPEIIDPEDGFSIMFDDGNRTFLEFQNNSNTTNSTSTQSAELDLYSWKVKGENSEGTNILGLVVFSILLGITIGYMGEKGRPLLDFFHALGEAMMLITSWVIWLSPVGILFLVCGKMLEMSTFSVIIGQLGMYFMTVMVGLFIHGFIVIPLIYAVVTRKMPFRFIFNLFEALITAFGTASSSATLPVTLRCLEDKNGVDRRVSRFVIPIGATINMDGTALYEAVAAIFIAQVRQVPLDIGKIIAVSITATAASIGAAGIPQAGLVTMVMVLNAVGLPADDVTLIIVVDWLLDRFRTLINVLGDSVGAGIVDHLSKIELKQCPDVEAQVELPIDDVNDKHVNGDAKCEDEIKQQSSSTTTTTTM